jgi:hypothetical protein
MKPTPDSFTQAANCCDFQKTFLVIPNKYMSCITGKIYNNDLFMKVMPMEGSGYIFKKPAYILGSGRLPIPTPQTNFPGFCVCVAL